MAAEPAFDLPSSLPYGDTTMATSLGARPSKRWLPGLADLPFRDQVLDQWRRSVLHRRRLLGTADPG